jgi:dienelactone hydrolase
LSSRSTRRFSSSGRSSSRDPGILEPADELYQRLRAHYQAPEHVDRLVIPGMGHPFADEPGLEAAPQTPDAARVDAAATTWFTRHLSP